jgi:hypothetical protein
MFNLSLFNEKPEKYRLNFSNENIKELLNIFKKCRKLILTEDSKETNLKISIYPTENKISFHIIDIYRRSSIIFEIPFQEMIIMNEEFKFNQNDEDYQLYLNFNNFQSEINFNKKREDEQLTFKVCLDGSFLLEFNRNYQENISMSYQSARILLSEPTSDVIDNFLDKEEIEFLWKFKVNPKEMENVIRFIKRFSKNKNKKLKFSMARLSHFKISMKFEANYSSDSLVSFELKSNLNVAATQEVDFNAGDECYYFDPLLINKLLDISGKNETLFKIDSWRRLWIESYHPGKSIVAIFRGLEDP